MSGGVGIEKEISEMGCVERGKRRWREKMLPLLFCINGEVKGKKL